MYFFSDIVSRFYWLDRDVLGKPYNLYDTKFSWDWEQKMGCKAHQQSSTEFRGLLNYIQTNSKAPYIQFGCYNDEQEN